RVKSVKLQDLLGDGLVLRVQEPVRSRSGEALVDQLEIRADRGVGAVVAGEGLGEIEDQIAVHARERMQALDRSVETVQGRGVAKLAERVGDFVLDFFLV